jgi:cytochrome d ubiquinol oxidase subunit II
MTSMTFGKLLPVIFIGLMGVSLLIFVVSDGYDLGVGMLMPSGDARRAGNVVASIAPF